MHSEDGSPLPLDLQLRRVSKSQVLLSSTCLRSLGLPLRYLGHGAYTQNCIAQHHGVFLNVPCAVWIDSGLLPGIPSHDIPLLPHVAYDQGNDYH